jgi:lipid-binding SYLF domain-containing protein
MPASISSTPGITLIMTLSTRATIAFRRCAVAWTGAALLLAPTLWFTAAAPAAAATAKEIDSRVDAALAEFYKKIHGARALVKDAPGVLVFPDVLKAGFGIGGQYGEGALRMGGRTVDYYNTVGLSFGFQLGAQSRTLVIVFRDKAALDHFRASDGWKIGVDGSVAVAKVGAGGTVDSDTLQDPIVAFIFDNQGLMYNLTLEGSKISKLKM